ACAIVRADGVDHPRRGKVARGGPARLTRSQAVREARDAILKDRGAARAVNRPVDPAPATHRPVGRIDDGIDVDCGDVSFNSRDFSHAPSISRGPEVGKVGSRGTVGEGRSLESKALPLCRYVLTSPGSNPTGRRNSTCPTR